MKFYFDIENLRIINSKQDVSEEIKIGLNINEINYNLLLNKYIDYRKNKWFYCKKYGDIQKIIEYIEWKNEKILNYCNLAYKIQATTASRLIVGHGEISVREVSIKLDHIYGVPLIPASSIKGAFKNYICSKYSNDIEFNKKNLDCIFGNNEKIGECIFLDAYPENISVEMDVMTPHYSSYYNEGYAPVDSLEPKPIKFPTIKEKTKFNFIIIAEKQEYEIHKNKKIQIKNEFKEFLEECSVGAKTSVGYGYFNDIEEVKKWGE